MSKAIRNKIVDTYTTRLQGLKAAVLVDYRGLSSAQASSLRSALRADKIRMTVLKNTSAQRAFDRMGWKDLVPMVSGPTALVYGCDDPILLSKRIVTWRQKNKVLEIRGGCIDGKAVAPATISQLAQMPGREQILAGTVGAIQAPLTSFVGTLEGVLRKFIGTVDAIAEKNKTAAGA
jgi:large subunit ribosomal protein L10